MRGPLEMSIQKFMHHMIKIPKNKTFSLRPSYFLTFLPTLTLRVSFSPAPERVDADCWNHLLFDTPAAPRNTVLYYYFFPFYYHIPPPTTTHHHHHLLPPTTTQYLLLPPSATTYHHLPPPTMNDKNKTKVEWRIKSTYQIKHKITYSIRRATAMNKISQ